MIIIFKTFQLGDWVEVGSVAGTVEEISIFTTLVRTADNRLITVPNSTFTTQAVTNYNAKPTRRIDLIFSISYSDDIQAAKIIINNVLASDESVLAEPVQVVAVCELGDNSVNLVVRPWCKSSEYWVVRWRLIENIKLALEAGGCTIPFPQRDVHFYQETSKKADIIGK